MSELTGKKVKVEISHNQEGGLSLLISDKNTGYRVQGAKIGGCETLKCFTVNAEQLIELIKEYAHD